LGYPQTTHATQGRTVDTAHLLIDSPIDGRGVSTPLTRGRDTNHAYITVDNHQTAVDVLAQALTRDWVDQHAIARRAQLDPDRTRRLPELQDDGDPGRPQRLILHSIEKDRGRARHSRDVACRARGATIS